jgi:hypothetical protein
VILFKDVPDLQAARCMPVIETVGATVLVDQDTGSIQSYTINGPVSPEESAWSNVFVRHSLSASNSTQPYNESYDGTLNMTTSYGVIFMDSMFTAADPNTRFLGVSATNWESITDNAFLMRDKEYDEPGLDDLLHVQSRQQGSSSFARLSNPHCTRRSTLQTFFQHFVSNGLSLDEEGLVCQKTGEDSMNALGAPIAFNGTALSPHTCASPNMKHTVEACVSNRIQVLHMNSTATYLLVVIVIWLTNTTAGNLSATKVHQRNAPRRPFNRGCSCTGRW